jgi:hypothetical protein
LHMSRGVTCGEFRICCVALRSHLVRHHLCHLLSSDSCMLTCFVIPFTSVASFDLSLQAFQWSQLWRLPFGRFGARNSFIIDLCSS